MVQGWCRLRLLFVSPPALLAAELLLRRPWWPGESDIEQLGMIFEALGTPTPANWPGAADLPHFLQFEPRPPKKLSSIFRNVRSCKTQSPRRVHAGAGRDCCVAERLMHRSWNADVLCDT